MLFITPPWLDLCVLTTIRHAHPLMNIPCLIEACIPLVVLPSLEVYCADEKHWHKGTYRLVAAVSSAESPVPDSFRNHHRITRSTGRLIAIREYVSPVIDVIHKSLVLPKKF